MKKIYCIWHNIKHIVICGSITILLFIGGIWGGYFKPYQSLKKYTGTITKVDFHSNISGHRGWFSFQCDNENFYIFHQTDFTADHQFEILQHLSQTKQEVTVTTIPKKNIIMNNFLEHGNQLYAGEIRDENQVYFDLDTSLRLEKRFSYICYGIGVLTLGLTLYFLKLEFDAR